MTSPGVQVHTAEVLAVIDRSLELAEQASRHLDTLGTVSVFIPGLHTFRAADPLRVTITELQRMRIALREAPR